MTVAVPTVYGPLAMSVKYAKMARLKRPGSFRAVEPRLKM